MFTICKSKSFLFILICIQRSKRTVLDNGQPENLFQCLLVFTPDNAHVGAMSCHGSVTNLIYSSNLLLFIQQQQQVAR